MIIQISFNINTLVCRVSGLACWPAWQHAHNFLVMFAWLHPKPYQPAFCPNLDPYSYQNEKEKKEQRFQLFHFNVHASDHQSNVSSWNFECHNKYKHLKDCSILHAPDTLFGPKAAVGRQWSKHHLICLGLIRCYQKHEIRVVWRKEFLPLRFTISHAPFWVNFAAWLNEGHNPGYFLQPAAAAAAHPPTWPDFLSSQKPKLPKVGLQRVVGYTDLIFQFR